MLLVAFALVAGAGATPTQTSGALELRAAFSPRWQFGDFCPPGTPASVSCVRFVGVADVPGLGRATATYTKTIETARCAEVEQFTTAVISVAGKGELRLSLPGPVCGQYAPARTGPLEIEITGGSGVYMGASGSVRFSSVVYSGSTACDRCGRASDTWVGTLAVPGLAFDLAPPVLTGTGGRTTRARKGAKSARVRYLVGALDARDGPVPVACSPRSGSLFELGRTKVTCTATDSDGNTSRAGFTVSVRPSG